MKNQIYTLICHFLIIFSFLILAGCGGGGGGGNDNANTTGLTPIPNGFVSGCFLENYPDPATSEYILPYQIGKKHDHYVLNDDQIADVKRRLAYMSHRAIAKLFNISTTPIFKIAHGIYK